jgi:hypothetical protein
MAATRSDPCAPVIVGRKQLDRHSRRGLGALLSMIVGLDGPISRPSCGWLLSEAPTGWSGPLPSVIVGSRAAPMIPAAGQPGEAAFRLIDAELGV